MEEGTLSRVVAHAADYLLDLRSVLSNALRDCLLLGLKSLVLSKVLAVLSLESLEDFALLSLVLMDLEELLNWRKLLVHRHAIVHDSLFLLADVLELVQAVLNSKHSRVVRSTLSARRLWDQCGEILACLRKQGKAFRVRLELLLYLIVGHARLLDFLLVVEKALLVSLIDGTGRWSVEPHTVLLAKLGVLGFFSVDDRLDLIHDISVDLFERFCALDSLREVLGSTFLLELFNLFPDVVRHVRRRSKGVKRLGEAKLREECIHLLVELRTFRELLLNGSVQYLFQLVLHSSHRRRDDVHQLLLDRCLLLQVLFDGVKRGEILRIELRHVFTGDLPLIEDLFVLVDCLSVQALRLVELGLKVAKISTAKRPCERLGLRVLTHSNFKVSDRQVHSFTSVRCCLELLRSKLPPGHGLEIARMVGQHILEASILEAAQIRADLARLVSLLEINGDLGGDLSQHFRVHTRIACLLKEEVLGLSQAQVAIHHQRLLVEVRGVAIRGHLGGGLLDVVEEPGRVAEVLAGHFDSVATQVHKAASPCEAYSHVIEGRQLGKKGRLGDNLLVCI